MKFNKKSQFFERYIRIIPVIYALIFLFRLFETASIIYSYGFSNEVVFSEFIGFCFDMLGAGIFIIGYAFLFFPLSKLPVAIIRLVNIGLLFILTVVYFLIIKYFLYQLIPLDVFLYKYTIAEIMFTINTGNTNYVAALAGLAVILIITLGIARVLDKIKFKPLVINPLCS
ncbi:MAG TPA: hypothetical protein DCQ31_14915 [Bacteroidales bacterium]|nr:hypothetical protein [Bacteroidales bacterium]